MTEKTFIQLRGVFLFFVGLFIASIYLSKFNIIDMRTAEGQAALTVWAYLGGAISLFLMIWGICDVFLNEKEDEEDNYYGE